MPVSFQDYESPDSEYADLTADNAVANWAELDLAGVNDDLKDLDGDSFDLDLLGIENFDLDVSDKDSGGDSDSDETVNKCEHCGQIIKS